MKLSRMPLAAVLWALTTALTYAAVSVSVSGIVKDPFGAAIADADVVLMSADLTPLATARTNSEGKFTLEAPATGRYLLVVTASHMGTSRTPLSLADVDPSPIEIVLHPGPIREDVTVTAAADNVEETRRAGQPVSIIDSQDIATRVTTAVAQAVEGETGVQLQRTSPTMAAVFIRGLTGNKVNVFIDGVRYSNGAQRGGVNTFLDLIEPGSLNSIEVVRGPSSAQYGSDALGGSIQFLTQPPLLGDRGGSPWGASVGASFGTSHRFGGGQAFMSYTSPTLGLAGSLSGRGVGRIRTGDGIDSHAAVTRFLGVSSDVLMDDRLPNTGFYQLGGSIRSNWAPSPASRLVLSYMRTKQDDGDRYDQLLGGDGNLISELNDLSLDLFSARFEKLGARLFDHVSVTYSLNSQREERVNQGGNGNPTATIGHEPERTTAHGIQGVATKALSSRTTLSVGGDVYFEGLSSDSFNVNPVTGVITPRRPRVPDGASFTQGGVFAQSAFDAVPDRVRFVGSLRVGGAHYEAHASDSPIVNGQPLWPDDQLTASAFTFRAASVLTPSEQWTVLASISRGFRAPHMTDLGTLGLTGSGFEVAAPDVADLDGCVGSTADANAVCTGDPVQQLGPETSLQYELGLGYRQKSWRTDFTFFVNDVHDNIQKQALILPSGAVGTVIGGQPITSQNANGVVFVPLSTVPVLVRANFDNARIWGIEHTAQALLGPRVTLHTAFTYLRAKDTTTDLPPNIEGGTPAPDGYVLVRWTSAGGRWWIEPYMHVAWKQTHLSTLDLGDRRTGAGRSRANIQAFFNNGARVRGWIGAGTDNVAGTSDDVLVATGETLAQIQNRVLGVGVNSAPVFTEVPGYAMFGVRAGFRRASHEILVDVENLTDENYRGISWGIDAPGFGLSVRYLIRF
jgi:hemoglobin/transferrin/lactoferrin receptor protein